MQTGQYHTMPVLWDCNNGGAAGVYGTAIPGLFVPGLFAVFIGGVELL